MTIIEKDVPGFHGVTTVAELKRAELQAIRRRLDGFHGVTTVAELKHPLKIKPRGLVNVSTASQPWPN